MTLEELERGFELHERRMTRLEENLTRLERNLTLHEEKLTRIEENLTVQTGILHRVDQRLDRLTEMFERSERERADDHERMRVMQTAMTSLFERMDAFIRGLERNDGHGRPSS